MEELKQQQQWDSDQKDKNARKEHYFRSPGQQIPGRNKWSVFLMKEIIVESLSKQNENTSTQQRRGIAVRTEPKCITNFTSVQYAKIRMMISCFPNDFKKSFWSLQHLMNVFLLLSQLERICFWSYLCSFNRSHGISISMKPHAKRKLGRQGMENLNF